MNSKKILPCGAIVVGSLFTLAGVGFAGTYVLEAIIARIGEPDQSLLFWYLPLLFIGIFGILIGLGFGVWGALRLKKIRQQSLSSEN